MLPRRVLFGLLALALLLAQALALMHRVAHAPQLQAGVQRPAAAALEHDHHVHDGHDPGHEADGWLAALFAHEGGDPGCRVLDSLGHDAMTCPPALQAAAAVPAFLLSFSLGEFLARRAALFEARGPPAAR
jgi:hypothetical protein